MVEERKDIRERKKNPLPSEKWIFRKGLGLWYLTPLSTIFKQYRGDQVY